MVDVIIKEVKTFHFQISANITVEPAVARKKIRNIMATQGYVVSNISVVTPGSGSQPWVVEVTCYANIRDLRSMPAPEMKEYLKDKPDLTDTNL